MNNEFEKNTVDNGIDDNTSEFTGTPVDKNTTEAVENAGYAVVSDAANEEEQVSAMQEMTEEIHSSEESDAAEDNCLTAAEEVLTHDANKDDISTDDASADEIGTKDDSAETILTDHSPIPGSKAYIYSKSGNGEENTVGCVWENTPAKKEKKSKKGFSGFRVFTAAMLSIFTLSVVTIAGFLVLDFVRDEKAQIADESVSESKPAAPITSQPHTTLISAFTEEEGGLTKSQVATKCQPSAVGIVIEQEQNYGGYSFPFGFGYDFNIPGGTQIVQGSGSGFIYSADGYIITNHHVVNGANKITVYFHDGSTAEAELIGSDALSDIAVIKIDATDKVLVPMEIGDSTLMKVGDEVLAIGCPAGIEFMGTVTDGIISAINRDVELDNDGSSTTKTMTLLQTNATINRGNSGGPLINTKGQVIGINTLKLSADYEGIGFSIPMSGALPIISQLIEHGKVVERTESFVSSEGVIGISASEITEQESKYYDIPMGVLVVQIDKDSSASKAGLRRGDIITKFNGEEVTTVNQLNKLKASFKAGDEVTLTVFRESDDTSDTFDITFKLDMAE